MLKLSERAMEGDVADMLNLPIMSNNVVQIAYEFYKNKTYPKNEFEVVLKINERIKLLCKQRFLPLLKLEMIPLTHRKYYGITQ